MDKTEGGGNVITRSGRRFFEIGLDSAEKWGQEMEGGHHCPPSGRHGIDALGSLA